MVTCGVSVNPTRSKTVKGGKCRKVYCLKGSCPFLPEEVGRLRPVVTQVLER